MSYVPPALRHKQNITSQDGNKQNENRILSSSRSNLHSLKDIQKHFWPNWIPDKPAVGLESHDEQVNSDVSKPGAQTETSPEVQEPIVCKRDATESPSARSQAFLKDQTHGTREAENVTEKGKGAGDAQCIANVDTSAVDPVHPHNTLNATEESPSQLQYILLFYDANPKWKRDRVIYVKSALEILPTANQSDTEVDSHPLKEPVSKQIMVFEQENSSRSIASSMFRFIGYYNLIKAEILEPHSVALVRMQEEKWTRTDRFGRPKPINRNAEGWKKSLSQRWAVLKLEMDKTSTAKLDAPQIKSSTYDIESHTKGQKSVNEMLRELRLNRGS